VNVRDLPAWFFEPTPSLPPEPLTFERSLAAYARGEIGFGVFLGQTSQRWRALAEMIVRRWKIPAAGSVEDIEQELRIAAWQIVPKYDPARAKQRAGKGSPRVRHATYGAISVAKREAHRLREVPLGGSVHPDKARSRSPMLFSQLMRDDEEGLYPRDIESRSAEDGGQERAAEDRRVLRRSLAACESRVEELAILLADEAGSVELAGRALWDDRNLALQLRLQSEAGARAVVRDALKRVAQRIGSKKEEAGA
jgi:hypothetical protein